MPCTDPRPFAHGSVDGTMFTPGSSVRFSCDSGFRLVGSSSLLCREGQWQGTVPRCQDIDECREGRCSQKVCQNTVGGYLCQCRKGYKLGRNGLCDDIDECKDNNGYCQGQCVNSAGSYRCLCPKGTQLTKDGLKCEDINECAKNGGRGPCDHFCENTFGGYKCKCRRGFVTNGVTCAARTCPTLNTPSNGKKIPHNDVRTVDAVATFSCNPNYKLIGSKSRTCLVDGTWSGNQPICSRIMCHRAPVLLNGQRSHSHHYAGSQISYSCNSGYKLVGKSVLQCEETRQWSDPAPRCIRTDCAEPVSPKGGKVVGSQTTIGSTIRYECLTGLTFAPNSIPYAECTLNKQWSNPSPVCQDIDCGNPGGLSNGQRSGSRFTVGNTVTYSCNTGYHISGSEKRTCQTNGSWSGVQPQCSVQSCGDPGAPVHGTKSGMNYLYDSVVKFSCDQGYKMIGDASRKCQTNGQWSGVQPRCEIVDCGDPGVPVNGERVGSDTRAGSELMYDCKPGYKLIGASKLLCFMNGTWSAPVPSCPVSSCGRELHGPSGSFISPDYPNPYKNNSYCRWKITVPVGKKILIRFKSLDTEYRKDWVTVKDPKSQIPITALSGINSREMMFTSNSNEMEIKFISDNQGESIGFEATYEQVSCGGIITKLNDVITSPSYPKQYPDSTTCVWQVILPGQPISLNFENFVTQQGYDFLKVNDRLDRFDGNTLQAILSGDLQQLPPLPSFTGFMHIVFTSNARNSHTGFKASIVKYRSSLGK